MIETARLSTFARIALIASLLLVMTAAFPVNASPYTLHAPISIIGNTDFTPQNGVTGGNGKSSNPYTISGWDIEVTTAGSPTIEIQNTTANFVIRNVYLHAIQGSNLLLINAGNGMIENSVMLRNDILAEYSQNILIQHNTLTLSSAFGGGDSKTQSRGLIIKDNFVTGYPGYSFGSSGGLGAGYATLVTITGNTLSSSGIGVGNADGAVITNNTITNSSISVRQSQGVTVANNTVSGMIDIVQSAHTAMSANTISGEGLVIEGVSPQDFSSQSVSATNLVNGLPIYYFHDCSGSSLNNALVGQVIVASCSGVHLSNLRFANVHDGLQLAFVNNTLVEKNQFLSAEGSPTTSLREGVVVTNSYDTTFSLNSFTNSDISVLQSTNMTLSVNSFAASSVGIGQCTTVKWLGNLFHNSGVRAQDSFDVRLSGNYFASSSSYADYGVSVFHSRLILVDNNNFTGGTSGIFLYGPLSSTIRNNSLGNGGTGIRVEGAEGLNVTDNIIYNNSVGIALYPQLTDYNPVPLLDIIVYHNSFFSNTYQAIYDYTVSAWDAGYPSGGNYWSDYQGVDKCSGPAQNVCTGSDGIGDTPYNITLLPTRPYFGPYQKQFDRYPLMKPLGNPPPNPPPDSNPGSPPSSQGPPSSTSPPTAPSGSSDPLRGQMAPILVRAIGIGGLVLVGLGIIIGRRTKPRPLHTNSSSSNQEHST